MAVVIRLTRKGRTKLPFYRVVAADKRRARDGRFLEVLGTYDPLNDAVGAKLKMDRINEWIGKGAQVTPVVRDLIRNAAAAEATSEA